MKHEAKLLVRGPVGLPASPPLAYDISDSALSSAARATSVRRYGKLQQGIERDIRPFALDYSLSPLPAANLIGNYNMFGVAISGINLAYILNPFAAIPAKAYIDVRSPDNSRLTTSKAITLSNQAFSLTWYISDEKTNSNSLSSPRLHYAQWGTAGAGYYFYVNENSASICTFAAGWTQGKQNQWVSLLSLSAPTSAETNQLQSLQNEIFEDVSNLSFRDAGGKDNWYGSIFQITFIPEPRGFLHIIIEGGETTSVEKKSITATGKTGILWTASSLTISSNGSNHFFQVNAVNFRSIGQLEFGPFQKDYRTNFSTLITRTMADTSGGNAVLSLLTPTGSEVPGDLLYNLGDTYFAFRVTLTGNGASTPWLYGASARFPTGAFSTSRDVSFDSSNLYHPVSGPREEGNPILDLNTVTERNGERHGTLLMRDVNGLTMTGAGTLGNPGLPGLMNRLSTLEIDGATFFDYALIYGGRITDAARYAFQNPGGTLDQVPRNIARPETGVELEWFDGWQLLRDCICSPPLIFDGQQLGAGIAAALLQAGVPIYSGIDLGPFIDAAPLGEAWVSVSGEGDSCADVILGLLDRYGFGLNFYQNNLGQWILEPVSTAIVAAFTSAADLNDPDARRTASGGTRFILQAPLDWYLDYNNFFNSFTVIWGADGSERYSTSRVEESYTQPNFINYLGRYKPYRDVRDSSLRSDAAAQYALRSLKWNYGRFTQFVQFPTYYHRDLRPTMRVTVDGILCEIISIGGTSLANDAMQLVCGRVPPGG